MDITSPRLIKTFIIVSIILFVSTAYSYKPSTIINHGFSAIRHTVQQEKPKQKNRTSYTLTKKESSDTTFTLKIENEKRVVDEKLKAKLTNEVKAAIANHHLKKPFKIAMGFTKGARDVETFLFGEQIFYTLAESGFSIKGTPLDMPEETPNSIPQVKVINGIIYIILSKM